MQENRLSAPRARTAADKPIERINSRDLFQQMREVEIAHEGRIYRLRLTQLNKLILTA
ncbi:MAG: hemin uptake protein HemP [Oxalicibacterium faecigallinarum]|nr:hemin uptake protein HemP [Oxalicibacterium faecigallinarum]MDQ7968945.1 hemin uptake protein HemP [Oxalicibacterium faecigallinarum]